MAWTLVTGGGKRLGAKICYRLAKEGHNILVHYRSSQAGAHEVVEVCRGLGAQAEPVKGDFSSGAATEAFIQTLTSSYPDIRHLINNVGNFYICSGLATPPEKWKELFQTNFHAPLMLIQALIPSIKKHRGRIVNIGAAGAGILKADTKFTAYTQTKTALLLLTKSLARELASSRVAVNMVSPGELEISKSLPKDLAELPMKRPGTVEEVVRVVAFLLDEKSDYITGQNIEVAGGLGL
jgi:NAD(P)-dependent dehydrogenase (short-subunit alcohol dehydrogenase family)